MGGALSGKGPGLSWGCSMSQPNSWAQGCSQDVGPGGQTRKVIKEPQSIPLSSLKTTMGHWSKCILMGCTHLILTQESAFLTRPLSW